MRRTGAWATILAMAVVVVGSSWMLSLAGEDAPQPTDSADLAAEVERLKVRIAELEKRLADLEQSRPLVFTTPPQTAPSYVLPHQKRAPNRPPRVWGEGEVNGTRYYIVPLQEGASDNSAQSEAQPVAPPVIAPPAD